MGQATFADLEYVSQKRVTRREKVSCPHGRVDPVGASGGAHSAVLSEGGAGSAALRVVGHVAGALRAVVLQPERSGDGGPAPRGRVGASVRGFAAVGSAAGRDDDPQVPASVGEARPGRGAVGRDQRAPGVAGLAAPGRDHRGCEPYRGAVVDEEQGGQAGPGDAPDEEGEPVVFRDEGAHRGGRPVGCRPQPVYDGGERERRDGGASAVARRGAAGVGGTRATRGLASVRRTTAARWTGGWR